MADNRITDRQESKLSIVYTRHGSDDFSGARLCNFSRGGLCFKSSCAIEPGAYIYVMIDEFPMDDLNPDPFVCCHAQVKWCNRCNGSDHPVFEIGVKYYEPAQTDPVDEAM